MRPILVLLMLSTIALAGCTESDDDGPVTSADCLEQEMVLGEDEEGNPVCVEPPFIIEEFEDPNHYCVVNKQRDRLHAPDLVGDPWVIGQSWTYSLEVDGNTSETKLIYYADQEVGADLPLHYMVGTPTREEALQHAIFSINPVIGRVHSILYSPHESGDHANMFNFPLCDGSSWQTVFYGETFTMTARRVPPVEAREFIIEGTSAEGSTLRIDYDADTQWFTLIDLDRADGQTVTMDLESQGANESGEAFFLRGQKDISVDLATEGAGPFGYASSQTEFERADGGAGPYDTLGIHAQMSVQGSGEYNVILVDPQGVGTPVLNRPVESDETELEVTMEVPFQSGTWSFDLTGAGIDDTGGEAGAEFTAQVVSIYDQSCTVGGDCLS